MDRLELFLPNRGDLSNVHSLLSTSLYVVVTCVVALVTLYYKSTQADSSSKLPSFDPLRPFEFTNTRRARRFLQKSVEVLTSARARFGEQPFKLATESGDVVVLPPKLIDQIKSDKRLSFTKLACDDMHGYIPGFEPFEENPTVVGVVTKYLTKALTKLTAPLSEEATLSLQAVLGDSPEWRDFNVHPDIMKIVSRLSSRVFLGEELCHDEGWTEAAASYTSQAFAAAGLLREFPRWARPIVHWFMPSCQEVRRAAAKANKYLQPHIDRRNALKAEMLARGEEDCGFNDSIEWFEREKCTFDPAMTQIALSLAAIHTTTDLLTQVTVDLALHPEFFAPLREEVLTVLRAEGLKKTALYNLKLMDSFIKESQRIKPISVGGWRRQAMEDMTLPNGVFLKKGTKIMIDSTHMWVQDYYENPQQFDPYRFARMREATAPSGDKTTGQQTADATNMSRERLNTSKHAHLVSTSEGHLGFGHGLHSCPGRFFAANEVKIALCQLLLKYDWKLPEGRGEHLDPISHGLSLSANSNAKLLIRRRQEEIDFASLDS